MMTNLSISTVTTRLGVSILVGFESIDYCSAVRLRWSSRTIP